MGHTRVTKNGVRHPRVPHTPYCLQLLGVSPLPAPNGRHAPWRESLPILGYFEELNYLLPITMINKH
eukprot:14306133-Heterocapsa_arctica.AAC.1